MRTTFLIKTAHTIGIMQFYWMQKSKLKFAVSLQLHIILSMLLLSSFGSSFFPLPYNVQQAVASTSVESNDTIIIPNKINFTTSEMGMLYPIDWNAIKGTFQSEDMNSIITFRLQAQNHTGNSSSAILNIARYDLGSVNTTIEQYVNLQLFSLRATIPDFQLIQYNSDVTLAGRPAYQIIYTGLEGTDETKTMKLWVIDHQSSLDTTAYTITYSAKPEYYDIYLVSIIDTISSFVIQEKVARAPSKAFLVANLLEYIPESSRQKLVDIANLTTFESILGDDITNFISFIEGSTSIVPSNFARLPANPDDDDDIAIYYHLSSAYLHPIHDSIYAILVLVFTDNSSNRVLVEPIDYKLRINGTNLNFEQDGSTSTGLDIRILNGTFLEEALRNSQEYELGVDVLNINRINPLNK